MFTLEYTKDDLNTLIGENGFQIPVKLNVIFEKFINNFSLLYRKIDLEKLKDIVASLTILKDLMNLAFQNLR